MRKTLAVLATVAAVGVTAVAAPAQARGIGPGVAVGLAAGTLTRAQVLRAIVQSREVDAREFKGAFVAMQYYGYLRRTPETAGYNAWLDYLTTHPTDFRTMVNGFMNAQEYRLRFGNPTQ